MKKVVFVHLLWRESDHVSSIVGESHWMLARPGSLGQGPSMRTQQPTGLVGRQQAWVDRQARVAPTLDLKDQVC